MAIIVGNCGHKMGDNRRQSWTITLSPHFAKPHLEIPKKRLPLTFAAPTLGPALPPPNILPNRDACQVMLL